MGERACHVPFKGLVQGLETLDSQHSVAFRLIQPERLLAAGWINNKIGK